MQVSDLGVALLLMCASGIIGALAYATGFDEGKKAAQRKRDKSGRFV